MMKIFAGDICARNIDATDIDYLEFCFAYKEFVCKSIQGEQENSKHFCLEGLVDVKG